MLVTDTVVEHWQKYQSYDVAWKEDILCKVLRRGVVTALLKPMTSKISIYLTQSHSRVR